MKLGTFTGRQVDLNDFKSTDIDLYDIVISLSRQNRYLGHILVDWSVLKHSIFCSMIANTLGYNDDIKKLMILHDVHETWYQDIATPIKQSFENKAYIAAVDKADEVIHAFFGMTDKFNDKTNKKSVKTIDTAAYIIELMCFRPTFDWNKEKDNHSAPVQKMVNTLIDLNFKVPSDMIEYEWKKSCEDFYEVLAVIHFEGNTNSEVVVNDPVAENSFAE